jgi:hypothetical protein
MLHPHAGIKSAGRIDLALLFPGWVAGNTPRGDIEDVLLGVMFLRLSLVVALVASPVSGLARVTAGAYPTSIFMIHRECVVLHLHA